MFFKKESDLEKELNYYKSELANYKVCYQNSIDLIKSRDRKICSLETKISEYKEEKRRNLEEKAHRDIEELKKTYKIGKEFKYLGKKMILSCFTYYITGNDNYEISAYVEYQSADCFELKGMSLEMLEAVYNK